MEDRRIETFLDGIASLSAPTDSGMKKKVASVLAPPLAAIPPSQVFLKEVA